MSAQWSRLTDWLTHQDGTSVTMGWDRLDALVGGLPASATIHHPQWWHGDRSQTRAWRAAGFELDHVDVGRSVTFRRTGTPVIPPPESPSTNGVPKPKVLRPSLGTPSHLPEVDPRGAMIILQCSKGKALGGMPLSAPLTSPWPDELEEVRRRVAADAQLDTSRLMPAWKRYTGTFYETCRPTLTRAITADANIVIISGGYGVVTAREPIGWYEKKMKLSDWQPDGVLERSLLEWAHNTHAESVIAFVSTSGDYALLIRRTAWESLGVPTYLVTARVTGGGAMVRVPRGLGRAFTAYWDGTPFGGPNDISVERLA